MFIDGTLIFLESSNRTTVFWDRCNTMFMAWLMNSIYTQIAESFLDGRISRNLARASRSFITIKATCFAYMIYMRRFTHSTQGNQTITQFFTTIKKIWKKFDNVFPLPTCNCAIKCACPLPPTNQKLSWQQLCHSFPKGVERSIWSRLVSNHAYETTSTHKQCFLMIIQ